MWFPTIPTDWTWTGQEIPAVLCFLLHANGSLRALISANALTSVCLRWYLLKFWVWNHSNKKVNQNKTIFYCCLFTDAQQVSQRLQLRLQSLMQSKADPMQHPATSTEPWHKPCWGPQGTPAQRFQGTEPLAKAVPRSSLTRTTLKQQRSVGQARASHRFHLQPSKGWMGTYLCSAPLLFLLDAKD